MSHWHIPMGNPSQGRGDPCLGLPAFWGLSLRWHLGWKFANSGDALHKKSCLFYSIYIYTYVYIYIHITYIYIHITHIYIYIYILHIYIYTYYIYICKCRLYRFCMILFFTIPICGLKTRKSMEYISFSFNILALEIVGFNQFQTFKCAEKWWNMWSGTFPCLISGYISCSWVVGSLSIGYSLSHNIPWQEQVACFTDLNGEFCYCSSAPSRPTQHVMLVRLAAASRPTCHSDLGYWWLQPPATGRD